MQIIQILNQIIYSLLDICLFLIQGATAGGVIGEHGRVGISVGTCRYPRAGYQQGWRAVKGREAPRETLRA